MQRGFAQNIVVLVIIGVIVAVAVGVLIWKQNLPIHNDGSQIACTQEAKICPDGSAVGRTGPNCEFTACPN